MPSSQEHRDRPAVAEADEAVDPQEYKKLLDLYDESMRNLTEGEIVPGRVIGITSNAVVVTWATRAKA